MARLNRQRAFDIALAGLRQQGRKCTTAEGDCVYRGPDGLKCGVGMLIPDKRYVPELEGKAAFNEAVLRAAGLDNRQRQFLDDLQNELHDALGPRLGGLEKAARRFAAHYCLTYTELSA